MTGPAETDHWVKCLPHKCKNPSLDSRSHLKLNVAVCAFNPEASMARQETEAGETPEFHELGNLAYVSVNERLSLNLGRVKD